MLIVVIVIGLLYALPNLFGEDPAVQITGARGVAASEVCGTGRGRYSCALRLH